METKNLGEMIEFSRKINELVEKEASLKNKTSIDLERRIKELDKATDVLQKNYEELTARMNTRVDEIFKINERLRIHDKLIKKIENNSNPEKEVDTGSDEITLVEASDRFNCPISLLRGAVTTGTLRAVRKCNRNAKGSAYYMHAEDVEAYLNARKELRENRSDLGNY